MSKRALLSPRAPLCLCSTVPGICTLAGAPGTGAAVVLGAEGHGSCLPCGCDLVSCAPARAEPVRLIQGAPRGQLAGIFASFNSQSSQEPGEGLSEFIEMKDRHEGQSQAPGAEKTWFESSLFPNVPLGEKN